MQTIIVRYHVLVTNGRTGRPDGDIRLILET